MECLSSSITHRLAIALYHLCLLSSSSIFLGDIILSLQGVFAISQMQRETQAMNGQT
jgi:hypothetical protein